MLAKRLCWAYILWKHVWESCPIIRTVVTIFSVMNFTCCLGLGLKPAGSFNKTEFNTYGKAWGKIQLRCQPCSGGERGSSTQNTWDTNRHSVLTGDRVSVTTVTGFTKPGWWVRQLTFFFLPSILKHLIVHLPMSVTCLQFYHRNFLYSLTHIFPWFSTQFHSWS